MYRPHSLVNRLRHWVTGLLRRGPVTIQESPAEVVNALRQELIRTRKLLMWHAVQLSQARRATEDIMQLREVSLEEDCLPILRLNPSSPLPHFCSVTGRYHDGTAILQIQADHHVLSLRICVDPAAPARSPDELMAQIGYRIHAELLDQFYNEPGPGDSHA